MKIHERTIDQQALVAGAEYEELPCNLCQRKDFFVLSRRDALGLEVQTVMCSLCGLIFISPRLTQSWYEKYYSLADGVRRDYKRGQPNPKSELGRSFESARRHGRALAERLGPLLKSGLTIDVGSAEGGLLAGMAEVLAIRPLGIEPTVSRAEYATSRGIPSYAAIIENIKTVAPDLPRAANVVCTKSLNHFLNPRFFFQWAHEVLEKDGRLVLEVKNFRQQARQSGRTHYAIQIDHPFMFVPETLNQFVRAAGFEILFFEVDEEKSRAERLAQKKDGLPAGHIRLAAKKIDEVPFAAPIPENQELVRRLGRELSRLNLYVTYLIYYATPMRNFLKRVGL